MTTTGLNSISTYTWRQKYMANRLQQVLRNNLVSERIYEVDRSDSQLIKNPYGSQPVAALTGLTGTYAVDDYTTTDDNLTVNLESKVAEQIYNFESILSNFDLFANRMDEQAYAVAYKIDTYGVNYLCDTGTGAYTTPAGGFTTAANVNTIYANVISKVAGYAEAYNGLFMVVENTDLPGIMVAGATNGFTFADNILNQGFKGQVLNYMGVDTFVVRSGTFQTATIGGTSFTNSGHRMGGVKRVATYAQPRGIQYEEKGVSGKTGKEVVTSAVCGFKLWNSKLALIVDITIA